MNTIRGRAAGALARDGVWLAILVLIGVFQLLRGAWISGAVFGVASAAACALTVRPRVAGPARHRAPHPTPPHRYVQLALALTAAGLLMLAPRHGAAETALVAAVGIGAAVIAVRPARKPPEPPEPLQPPVTLPDAGGRSHPRPPHAPRRSALTFAASAWAGLLVVAGLWEATAYLTTDKWHVFTKDQVPAVTDLVDPMLDVPLAKNVFVALWIAAGVPLLTRAWTARRAGPPAPAVAKHDAAGNDHPGGRRTATQSREHS